MLAFPMCFMVQEVEVGVPIVVSLALKLYINCRHFDLALYERLKIVIIF